MPLYALIAKDKPNNVDQRLAVRPAHLVHLESLGNKVVFAGAFQTEEARPTGSLVVIEAPNLTEATMLFEQDPFVRQGVFHSYEITRWNWAINNPDKRGQ
ncbi:MAG: YciI family protein [Devosia sp.]|nr:YciI family protein [Devosia sp.]